MRDAVPTIAALLLPLAVTGAAGAWLTTPTPQERPPQVVAIQDALARGKPGIVILGNSKATSDIDRKVLRTTLGYEPQIVTTNVAATSAPAWYAVLEQQVFAGGFTPEIVIVYGQFGAILRTEAPYAYERKAIEDLLVGPSPALEQKVLGDVSSRRAIARHRATTVHGDLLTAVRDYAVGALLATDRAEGVRVAGAALAQPALDKLLGANAHFLAREAARVVPVVDRPQELAMTAGDTPPAESLIPDFMTLAAAHGARIVFVRAPMAPSTTHADSVSAEVERDALAVIAAGGASWIDLHALDLPTNAFKDDYHAGPVGRALITQALADAVVRNRILEGGVAEATPPLLPTSVERVGTPPALPPPTFERIATLPCAFLARLPAPFAFVAEDFQAANGFPRSTPLVARDASGAVLPRAPNAGFGATCAGAWQHRRGGAMVAPATGDPTGITFALASEASVPDDKGKPTWWVYPGTTTRWHYDAPPEGGTVRVSVEARASKGATATLRVAGVPVSLEPVGRQLRASLDLDVSGPWDLDVEAGRDTWLKIDQLLIGDDPPRAIVESEFTSVSPLFHRRRSASTPVAIAQGAPPVVGPTSARIDVPELAWLADDRFNARLGRPCSPVQVVAGEEPITEAHLNEKQANQPGRRGYAHLGDALILPLPSEKMPAGPYSLRLDPARRCGSATWVYPGDTQGWTFGGEIMRKVGLPPDRLIVDGVAFAPPEAATPVRFVAADMRGQTLWSGDLTLPTEGDSTRRCLTIDPPLKVGVAVTFRIENPEAEGTPLDQATWYLLDRVLLTDSEHAEGCE